MDEERSFGWNEGLDICTLKAWVHKRASFKKIYFPIDLKLQVSGYFPCCFTSRASASTHQRDFQWKKPFKQDLYYIKKKLFKLLKSS